MKIFKCAPPEGFFIYSSSGCGDEVAIRFCYVKELQELSVFNVSPSEAIKIASVLKKIAEDYIAGVETGIYSLCEPENYEYENE